jgi:hypothetical protein
LGVIIPVSPKIARCLLGAEQRIEQQLTSTLDDTGRGRGSIGVQVLASEVSGLSGLDECEEHIGAPDYWWKRQPSRPFVDGDG